MCNIIHSTILDMILNENVTFGDLFAGGGGASTGAYSVPGVKVKWALNHSDTAIKTHKANHPETKHYQADIRKQDEKVLAPVDIIWCSLECTEHSKAKGGKAKNIGSFTLGWELPRYLISSGATYLIIENVPDFIRWGELTDDGNRIRSSEGTEYRRWVQHLKDLGWGEYQYKMLNAADFGAPTRRIRYFGIFAKTGHKISWPAVTHHPDGNNLFGLKQHVACKDFIDLDKEGVSIFGRTENPEVKRKVPLSPNTMRRIAGGIKKFAPDIHFIMKYYGTGNNCSSIEKPLHTVTTKERMCLITTEKNQFVTDHIWGDAMQEVSKPLNPILTRQTKQLITVEKKQFISDSTFSDDSKNKSIENPLSTLTAQQRHQLVTVEKQFLSKYYNGNRKNGKTQDHASDINKPYPTITTVNRVPLISAKAQFISSQYSSNGKPEANNKSIDKPLNAITTQEKHQFISTFFTSATNGESMDNPTIEAIKAGEVEFDIKMRFLTHQELAKIMGFPDGYFTREGLNLNSKQIHKLIGNAVHTTMSKVLVEHNRDIFREGQLKLAI